MAWLVSRTTWGGPRLPRRSFAAMAKAPGRARRLAADDVRRDAVLQADQRLGVARLAMPLTAVDQAMGAASLGALVASVLGLGVAVLMSSAAAHLAARSLPD